jgi:lipopolysaccharide export LptBFGC system permease protein LptF
MALFFCAGLIVMLFEFLSLDALANPWSVLAKMPFSLHKMFPFITFVTILMFTWRLMQYHEWEALTSMGYAPWHILRTPMIWIGFLGLMDIFFIVPLAQRFFNPFTHNKTEISLSAKGWLTGKTKDGYLFFQPHGPKAHLIQFTEQSVFVRHIVAPSIVPHAREICCHDAWDIGAHKTPTKKKAICIPLAQNLVLDQPIDHPLLMSLSQINTAIHQKSHPSLLLYARRHYWWGHFFWSLALAPLAMSILVGPSKHRYWKILLAGTGIVGCLMLYLVKEWLYALSIPLSHTWSPLLIWMPSVFTAAIAWGIFFEKKEL